MKARILICDDDQDIVEVTKIILESNHYTVYSISHLSELTFLDKVKEIEPDLILMDLWIADIGGARATNLIKKSIYTSSIPILLFSANNDIERVAFENGAEGYVCKPFNINELISKVEENLKVYA